MLKGCGLCCLLWETCQVRSAADGDAPPPDDIQFRLAISSESRVDGHRLVSPEGIQSLDVTLVGGFTKGFYIYCSPGMEHKSSSILVELNASR